MQLRTLLLLSVLFGLVITCPTYGQPSNTLMANTALLSVTVKTDRDVYFPGELLAATIEVVNPTETPLLVFTPFGGAGCMMLYSKNGENLVALGGPHGNCYQDGSMFPTTTMAPRERRTEVWKSYGESFARVLTATGGAPDHAGTFVLSYTYGAGGEAEFAVVNPKLEKDIAVRVKDLIYSDKPGGVDPQAIPAYVEVFAVRWRDQSYICVSQSDRTNLTPDPTRNPDELDLAVSPYKRVAASQESVVKLSATSDPDENLAIEWTTASGREDRLHYPASYVVRDAHERARKRMLEELNKDK